LFAWKFTDCGPDFTSFEDGRIAGGFARAERRSTIESGGALVVFYHSRLEEVRRRRYTVTNKRVAVDYGIVNRISNEVRISDIRSINLQKTGFTGLLGIGRVEFSSAATDDADVIFWNTPEAEKVRDLVRSLQP